MAEKRLSQLDRLFRIRKLYRLMLPKWVDGSAYQLVLWAFDCCHSDGSDWVTRSLQAGDSSLEGVEQQSSSHNLQQRARKAIEYCKKAAAHARSGNSTSPGAEDLGELGHIAIEIMQGVHADIGEPLFIVSCMASPC